MAIGKDMNSRVKLENSSQSIRRDALTEEEVWLMCCVALSEKDTDLETLADSKTIIRICEEYANGGIKALIRLDQRADINNKQYEEFLEDAINKLN